MKIRSRLVFLSVLGLLAVLCSLSTARAQAPQGYWNFNNSGNIGFDSSANANQLTANGNAVFTAAGQFGGGLALDGAGDFLGHATFPTGIPTGGSGYTISAWIRPTASGARGIVGWGNYGTGNQVNAFRLDGNTNDLHNYWWGNDFVGGTAPTNLYDGNWHHVVATHNGVNGGSNEIWVDGRLIGQRVASNHAAAATANSFAIGRSCTFCGGGEFFQGTIDDVAIYNSALTGNQIKALATSSANPLALPSAGATARWVANDLNALADGAAVASWVDNIGGANLAQGTVANRPVLVKNVTQTGSSAVRFDGLNDNLRVPALTNPMSGNDDFSIAVALQTMTAGAGPSGQWYQNSGIVDGEQPGVADDWGLVLNGAGLAGAGLGNPDVTTYGTSNLADGEFHTAVYTRDGSELSLYIDGVLESTINTGGAGPVNFADLVVGSLQTNLNFFNGDIFEIQIYDFELTAGQVAAVNSELVQAHNAAVPEPASIVAWLLAGILGVACATQAKRIRRRTPVA